MSPSSWTRQHNEFVFHGNPPICHGVLSARQSLLNFSQNSYFDAGTGPKRDYFTFMRRPSQFPDSRSAPLTRFIRKPRKAELREVSFRSHASAILT